MIEIAVNAPYTNEAHPIVLRMVDLRFFTNRLLLFLFTIGNYSGRFLLRRLLRQGGKKGRDPLLHPQMRGPAPLQGALLQAPWNSSLNPLCFCWGHGSLSSP